VPKEKKTSAEIELMIVDAVRAHRGCEDFRGISIYKIVDPSAAGVFNWSPIWLRRTGTRSSRSATRRPARRSTTPRQEFTGSTSAQSPGHVLDALGIVQCARSRWRLSSRKTTRMQPKMIWRPASPICIVVKRLVKTVIRMAAAATPT